VYDVAVATAVARADMAAGDLWLCVDRRVAEVYDIDDATKVKTEDDRIVDIGKTIPEYDCIDCGVFAVNDALLDSLAAEEARRGDCSLSDGVKHLARSGRAKVADIGDAFWQDVDTPDAQQRAERELARLERERA
jgi:choline kinase